MSVIEALRRNDPQVTHFRLFLNEDVSDATLTDALEHNHHIVSLACWMGAPVRTWPMLLRHLETRNNLFGVALIDGDRVIPEAQWNNWLQALQRNHNIRHWTICNINAAVGVIAPYLNAATHITHLSIIGSVENNGNSIDLLASALQRHPNLEQLELACVQAEYLVSIFDSLKTNLTLRTLNVCFQDFSAAALASFEKLLRSTSTIRKLIIYNHPNRPRDPALGETRETVLKIVKSNFSLREVRGEDDAYGNDANTEGNVFRENDQRRLAFYADRNEHMAQWIEKPTDTVPNKDLWPRVLTVAAATPGADPSVLFRCLMAISGDLGTVKRTRKRRRPAYFEP